MLGSIYRRQFLLAACALGCLTSARNAFGGTPRTLAFENLHTEEKLEIIFWADGIHIGAACSKISHLLRDHRTGEVAAISTRLLDLLHLLRERLRTDSPFEVISGYRSRSTNSRMVAEGHGVVESSLHTQGMAIDIRIPGCSTAKLRDCAATLRCGGVGFYPKSGFVHVDVGRVRYW